MLVGLAVRSTVRLVSLPTVTVTVSKALPELFEQSILYVRVLVKDPVLSLPPLVFLEPDQPLLATQEVGLPVVVQRSMVLWPNSKLVSSAVRSTVGGCG